MDEATSAQEKKIPPLLIAVPKRSMDVTSAAPMDGAAKILQHQHGLHHTFSIHGDDDYQKYQSEHQRSLHEVPKGCQQRGTRKNLNLNEYERSLMMLPVLTHISPAQPTSGGIDNVSHLVVSGIAGAGGRMPFTNVDSTVHDRRSSGGTSNNSRVFSGAPSSLVGIGANSPTTSSSPIGLLTLSTGLSPGENHCRSFYASTSPSFYTPPPSCSQAPFLMSPTHPVPSTASSPAGFTSDNTDSVFASCRFDTAKSDCRSIRGYQPMAVSPHPPSDPSAVTPAKADPSCSPHKACSPCSPHHGHEQTSRDWLQPEDMGRISQARQHLKKSIVKTGGGNHEKPGWSWHDNTIRGARPPPATHGTCSLLCPSATMTSDPDTFDSVVAAHERLSFRGSRDIGLAGSTTATIPLGQAPAAAATAAAAISTSVSNLTSSSFTSVDAKVFESTPLSAAHRCYRNHQNHLTHQRQNYIGGDFPREGAIISNRSGADVQDEADTIVEGSGPKSSACTSAFDGRSDEGSGCSSSGGSGTDGRADGRTGGVLSGESAAFTTDEGDDEGFGGRRMNGGGARLLKEVSTSLLAPRVVGVGESGIGVVLRTACNQCTQKKIKCDGTQPCRGCRKKRLSCTFSVSQKQGKRLKSTRNRDHDKSRLTAKDDRLKPSNPTTAAATPNANVVTSAIPTSEAPANTTSNDTSNAPLNAATVRGTAAGRVTISPRQSDFGGSSRGSCPAPNRDNTRGSGRGRSRRGLFGSGIRSARGKFVDRSEGGFRGRSQDGRMAASLLDTHSNAAWEGSGPTRVKVRSNGREDTPGNCEHEESEGGTRGGDVKEANSSIAVFGGDCRRNNRKRHRMSDVEGPKSSDSRQRATSGAMSRNKHGHRLPRRAQAGQRQVVLAAAGLWESEDDAEVERRSHLQPNEGNVLDVSGKESVVASAILGDASCGVDGSKRGKTLITFGPPKQDQWEPRHEGDEHHERGGSAAGQRCEELVTNIGRSAVRTLPHGKRTEVDAGIGSHGRDLAAGEIKARERRRSISSPGENVDHCLDEDSATQSNDEHSSAKRSKQEKNGAQACHSDRSHGRHPAAQDRKAVGSKAIDPLIGRSQDGQDADDEEQSLLNDGNGSYDDDEDSDEDDDRSSGDDSDDGDDRDDNDDVNDDDDNDNDGDRGEKGDSDHTGSDGDGDDEDVPGSSVGVSRTSRASRGSQLSRKNSDKPLWSQLRKACDRCTSKKVKCDGQQGCFQCSRVGAKCNFSICRRSGPRDSNGQKTGAVGLIIPRDGYEKVTGRRGSCRTLGQCPFALTDGSSKAEHYHCRAPNCEFASKTMDKLMAHRHLLHPEMETDSLEGRRAKGSSRENKKRHRRRQTRQRGKKQLSALHSKNGHEAKKRRHLPQQLQQHGQRQEDEMENAVSSSTQGQEVAPPPALLVAQRPSDFFFGPQ